jgi:sugar phosphate isomerase/epimerase
MGIVNDFLRQVHKAHHLHIHDNNGMSDQHLPLGEGTIPWNTVGETVASGYNGLVVIEGRSIDEAQKSLAVFRRWFR